MNDMDFIKVVKYLFEGTGCKNKNRKYEFYLGVDFDKIPIFEETLNIKNSNYSKYFLGLEFLHRVSIRLTTLPKITNFTNLTDLVIGIKIPELEISEFNKYLNYFPNLRNLDGMVSKIEPGEVEDVSSLFENLNLPELESVQFIFHQTTLFNLRHLIKFIKSCKKLKKFNFASHLYYNVIIKLSDGILTLGRSTSFTNDFFLFISTLEEWKSPLNRKFKQLELNLSIFLNFSQTKEFSEFEKLNTNLTNFFECVKVNRDESKDKDNYDFLAEKFHSNIYDKIKIATIDIQKYKEMLKYFSNLEYLILEDSNIDKTPYEDIKKIISTFPNLRVIEMNFDFFDKVLDDEDIIDDMEKFLRSSKIKILRTWSSLISKKYVSNLDYLQKLIERLTFLDELTIKCTKQLDEEIVYYIDSKKFVKIIPR